MKGMTKQVVTAGIILGSVTVLSLGIRQVRLSVGRGRDVASGPAASSSGSASSGGAPGQYRGETHGYDEAQSAQGLHVQDEQGYEGGDMESLAAAGEPERDGDGDPGLSRAEDSKNYEDSGKHADSVYTGKSFKGGYFELRGSKKMLSKGFKGSGGGYEEVVATKNGEYWYVSKSADGTTTKMQLQTENSGDGVVIVGAGEANVYPADGGRVEKGGGEDAGGK